MNESTEIPALHTQTWKHIYTPTNTHFHFLFTHKAVHTHTHFQTEYGDMKPAGSIHF